MLRRRGCSQLLSPNPSSSLSAVVFTRRAQHSRSRRAVCALRVSACSVSVVFVTTEVAPYSKSGGLGDVLQALPASLAAR